MRFAPPEAPPAHDAPLAGTGVIEASIGALDAGRRGTAHDGRSVAGFEKGARPRCVTVGTTGGRSHRREWTSETGRCARPDGLVEAGGS